MSEVQELTGNGFSSFVKEGYVLVDFFADWCMPCLMMAPILDDLSEEFKNKVKFAKVNIEENNELAHKYGITSIPNFILFKDGEKVEQFVGAMNEDDFKEKLNGLVE